MSANVLFHTVTNLLTRTSLTQIAGLLALLFIVLLTSLPAQAQIYRWVDADGKVHYSDQPKEGAEQVQLSPTNHIPSRSTLQNSTKNNAQNSQAKTAAEPNLNYQLHIVQPEAEATIRDNNGELEVSVSLNPLPQGAHFQILLDGKIWTQKVLTTNFVLKNIERGAHQLTVQAFDASGNPLATSQAQTFYMHQASALINRAN